MQVNKGVHLNKFSLNVSSTFESGLKFNQGEILKGQVEEIKENGLVSINLKGKIIDALSTVQVSKGQELFLIVDDIRDGKTILKVLTSEMLNKMENTNLSNTLAEISVPSHGKNLEMAKKLIQHNLPVTAENIQDMSKGVNLLDGASPRNLELVGLAMGKGAPITQETLESLARFLEGKSDIASLTKETVDLLQQIESNMTPLTGAETTDRTNVQASSPNPTFQLLKEIIETTILPVNENPTSDLANEITEALKTNLRDENDLLRGLNLVKDILKEKEIPGNPKSLTNSLVNKLDDMGKELAGQKLSNVMSRFSTDSNLDFYYLAFPVKIEDQYRLSQLKISKNPGKQSLADMDNVNFVVSLDTSNLGLVLFHVKWYKSASLKIEGVVENETTLEYIETNVDKLIKDLESHNYIVDYKGIKVSANGNEDMRLKLEEKTEKVKPFKIDIWV